MATAAAPKTDSVDSVDFNNEDYNIRSMERTQLLTKIKEVIRGADVSPAFWACCQLADVSRLQTIAQADPDLILGYDDSVALLPLQCELLGFELRLYYVTVDILTVNRESAIPGFGITGSLAMSRRCKDAQIECGWTIMGAAVGARGR